MGASHQCWAVEKDRCHQFWIFLPNFFWSLSWVVMAQYVILSPHSQLIERDALPAPVAASSMSSSFDIVLLQWGHIT